MGDKRVPVTVAIAVSDDDDEEEMTPALARDVIPGATSKTLARLVGMGLNREALGRVVDAVKWSGCGFSAVVWWLEQGFSLNDVECYLEIRVDIPGLSMPAYQVIITEFGPFSIGHLVDMLDTMLIGARDGRNVWRVIHVVREVFGSDFLAAARFANDNPEGWRQLLRSWRRYSSWSM